MALFKGKYRNSIWFHLLLMLAAAVVLYILFFTGLSKITAHGDEQKMPVLIDKTFEEAITILKKEGYGVDVDSAYDMKKDFGVVLSQTPDTGVFVKKGRTVFIIINKGQAPMVPMPDLTGISFQSAAMVLKSNKLRLGDTVHRPDIADGAILEQLYKGEVLSAGDMIPQGSTITLVIGDGLGNVEFDVPNVMGMTYPEAIAVLNASGLQFIDLWDGGIKDSLTAVIYYQSPEAINNFGGKNQVKEGDLIDMRVRQGGKGDMQGMDNKKAKKKVSNSNADNDGDWGN